jgi:RNA 2',3'-cyclic 3'-phosphodiesterase
VARDRASRPEAKPLRLFVAVDVPAHVKDDLDRVVDPYRPALPGARWTKPENWHVTVKFLGATWPRLVDEVKEALTAAASSAAATRSALTRIGAFPSPRRGRVIWAGLADDAGSLAATAADLDRRLQHLFTPEKRALTPHLTLARLRIPADLELEVPELFDLDVATETFPVPELVLYRSHLSPRGAMYEPIHRARLERPGEMVDPEHTFE